MSAWAKKTAPRMPTISNIIRENQGEVLRRWLEDLHGQIAEDYEQALSTPMGKDLARKLLKLVIDFVESESYREADRLRRVRTYARETAYRRASVGYSLADIVATGISFRRALNFTIMNHFTPAGVHEAGGLLEAVLAVDRFGDAVLGGEIDGFLAYRESDMRGGSDLSVGTIPTL